MQSEFLAFLNRHKLIDSGEKTLLAISGGVDSVVMADLFIKNNFRVGLVHCNFGLRGKASDQDEQFLKDLADQYSLPFYSRFLDANAEANREKISIQMAARNLRYQWFWELLASEPFQKLATAHHGDDLVETILLNIVRGTGITGLHGILPKQQKIIRPMLFAGKSEIINYAYFHQLQWREDETNQSLKYRRNLIRHRVIPVLKSINPDLARTILSTSERVQAAETFYREAFNSFKSQHVAFRGEDVMISIAGLHNTPEATALLWEFLKSYRFTYKQVKTIIDFIGNKNPQERAGRMFYSPDFSINIDREYLIISPLILTNREAIKINVDDKICEMGYFKLEINKFPAHSYKIQSDRNIAALDLDRLQFPLCIRPWHKGDWFIPLGMKHKKKLSDFMIDEKIPLYLKSRLYVLLSGNDIVWVVGYRIDNRFKITNSTKTVYQAIKYNYDQSI